LAKKIDPELLGEVFARVTGREYIMSGELPHGNQWAFGWLIGDDDWVSDPDHPHGGYRTYTWSKVKPGDLMIFWSRQNRGKIITLTKWVDHYLSYEEELVQPPRKGDKYSIMRDKK
jgi:hypothetical protein